MYSATYCAKRGLSGIVCIDFIVDQDDGTPYAGPQREAKKQARAAAKAAAVEVSDEYSYSSYSESESEGAKKGAGGEGGVVSSFRLTSTQSRGAWWLDSH